jgi:serine/threonine protein kinase
VLQEESMVRTDCFEAALEKTANADFSHESIDGWRDGSEIGNGDFFVAKPVRCLESGENRAMKTQFTKTNVRYVEREKSIHEKLNHPLIVGFEKYIPATKGQPAAILNEFVPNGSLADHLPQLTDLLNGTRIAMILTGIVLAMRYLHSQNIIHRDLKPANVFLDWNWIDRIGEFDYSLLSDAFGVALDKEMSIFSSMHTYDVRYIAPECFNDSPNLKSDVFSFGLIFYELITGSPPFPPDSEPFRVAKRIGVNGFCPNIPDWIIPNVKTLIIDCLKKNPEERPSFTDILWQLNEIGFQITEGVDSVKVAHFVKALKDREKFWAIEIDDFE